MCSMIAVWCDQFRREPERAGARRSRKAAAACGPRHPRVPAKGEEIRTTARLATLWRRAGR